MNKTPEQKSLEILHAIARLVSEGQSITFKQDWEFGTLTIILGDGRHTHAGVVGHDDEVGLYLLVDELYDLFVKSPELSQNRRRFCREDIKKRR